jgi:glycosyltransferase involved in cell wall biosynthesis
MNVSLVIPLYNEDESLPELVEWINRVMVENKFSHEILLIDDGSTDSSWKVILDLNKKFPEVKGIRFRRNYGKSAGLNVGFDHALGDVIITMDADLQDNPDEIPELYKMIAVDGFDLVSGWKQKRYDPFMKTFPTKIFNWATRKMSGLKLHDFNCGLKAYRKEVIKSIEVYGEMHRYIPVIAKTAGFRNVGEKVVKHQSRKYGVTKFGWERFINGLLDLVSIYFVGKFGKRPMHFFGLIGTISFIIGFGIAFYLAIAKFAFQEYKMTERPLFYLGLLAMIIGVQLFLAGFLGELISRNSTDRNNYQLAEKVGY